MCIFRLRFPASLLCFALVVSLPALASAQIVTLSGPDRVTVKAQDVPLGRLLTELTKLLPMEKVEIDPAHESQPVTLVAESVPIRVAILLALRASDLDFMLTERQLWVGATAKIIDSAREPASRPNEREPAVDHRAAQVAPPSIASPGSNARRDDDDPDHARHVERTVVGPSSAPEVVVSSALPEPSTMASAAADATNEFDHMLPVRAVPFVVNGDSVVVTEPGFVPYKNRPEVQRLRLSTDVSTIP